MVKKVFRRMASRRKKRMLQKLSPEMIYGVKLNGQMLPDTRIGSTTTLVAKEKLEIEDNVFIGQYNFIEASNGIRIAEGCQITNYISVLSHSSHISIRLYGKEYRKTKDPIGYLKGSVELGKYSFVGPFSVIMPGSKIGKGCLVSAYSYVNGEFPDFSVIAGNPAKVIGDTREIDKEFLENHPELEQYYNEWARD